MRIGFIAEGTTCVNCEKIIERQAKRIEGVQEVDFDYHTETGHITFDENKTDIDTVLYKIEEKGYTCYLLDESENYVKKRNTFGWIFGVAGVILIGYFLFSFVEGIQIPQISQGMGYGLLLVVGLLTGFHCISMCGGFVVSYTANDAKNGIKSLKSHIKYGISKTLSYTIIGAMFGLLGSIVAFTPKMRGIAGILAGLFLLIFGLNMLGMLPALRKIRIKLPKSLNRLVEKKQKNSNPIMIGLLNGLMIACGPLQAIYIMAAGTGSMIEGAKILFIFGIGTLPALLGFGYFTSYLSGKATQKILKASGAIVIILGLFMLNNGLVLTGSGYDFTSMLTSASATNQITGDAIQEIVTNNGFQEIRMSVDRYGWTPDTFVLQKGVPVKWIIDGQEITGCNNAIQVPNYDLEFPIKKGEQVIEFTPDKEGVVRWSCWMGMIPGTFIVTDNVDKIDEDVIQKQLNAEPPIAGSCGGSSGGGCGCGG